MSLCALASAVCVDCRDAGALGFTDAENGLTSGAACGAKTCDQCGGKGCDTVTLDDCRDLTLCSDCKPDHGCHGCPDCDPESFPHRARRYGR